MKQNIQDFFSSHLSIQGSKLLGPCTFLYSLSPGYAMSELS
jgi:hypothetical protein